MNVYKAVKYYASTNDQWPQVRFIEADDIYTATTIAKKALQMGDDVAVGFNRGVMKIQDNRGDWLEVVDYTEKYKSLCVNEVGFPLTPDEWEPL